MSGATTLGQSEPGSDDNEGVLRIPPSSLITGTSPSDCLMPYPGYSLDGSRAFGVFYSPSRQNNPKIGCPGYDTKLRVMVRLQFWKNGEYGVAHPWYYSFVHTYSM